MPMPIRLLGSSRAVPDTQPICLDDITDPEARREAEKINAEKKKVKDMLDLEEKTRKEYQEAYKQFKVLEKIPTLTREEREQNNELTFRKQERYLLVARKTAEVVADAAAILNPRRDKQGE